MGGVLPKVLHRIGSKPMLSWSIDKLRKIGIVKIQVVIQESMRKFFLIEYQSSPVLFCLQHEQKGTADAVAACYGSFPDVRKPVYAQGTSLHDESFDEEYVLIITADTPAISTDILKMFICECLEKNSTLAVIATRHPNPSGYGRVVSSEDGFVRIVEEQDAGFEIKEQNLCNTGVVFVKLKNLFDFLSEVRCSNSQKEYYLTDIFSVASKKGFKVDIFETTDWESFMGVNTQEQLQSVIDVMKCSSHLKGDRRKV